MWSGTTRDPRITTTTSSTDHVQQESDSNPSRMNHSHNIDSNNHQNHNDDDDNDILLYNQQQQQQQQHQHQDQNYHHQQQVQQQQPQVDENEVKEEESSSSSSIEELFSQCIPNLLMNIEELRQYYIMIVPSQSQSQQQQSSLSLSNNNSSSSSTRHTNTDTNIIIITIEVLQELHHRMNIILQIIHQLQSYFHRMYNYNQNNYNQNNTNDEYYMNHLLVYEHVIQKSINIIQPIIHTCCLYYIEPIDTNNDTNDNNNHHHHITTLSIEEQRRIGQGYIARIIEIHIIIIYILQQQSQQQQQQSHVDTTKDTTTTSNINNNNNNYTYYNDIIQLYTQYQKRTLRVRCKPCIAQLVNIRKQQHLQQLQQNQNQNSIWNTMNNHTYINQLINTSINTTSNKNNTGNGQNEKTINDEDDDDDIPAVVVDISNIKNTSTTNNTNNNNNIILSNTLLSSSSILSSLLSSYEQYHAPVFTVILGTAITLIHPLYSWMNQLSISIQQQQHEQHEQEQLEHNHHHHQSSTQPNSILYNLCHSSIIVLMEQTQILIRTIYDWFYIDRKIIIDYYNNNNNNNNQMNYQYQYHHQIRLLQLGQLNSMVDEMAYIAQILQRYQTFIQEFDFFDTNHNNHKIHTSINNDNGTTNSNNESNTNNNNIITNEILPEWIWQYSTYERILVLQLWQISISSSSGSTNGTNPTPVCIVIGTKIRVSSCIEDAQYISNRAIDRSISTQSIYAIANVVYTIVHDLWSTDEMNHPTSTKTPSPSSNGKNKNSSITSAPTDDGATTTVYQALIDEIGCWNETDDDNDTTNDNNNNNSIKSKGPASGNSNDFAAALLDALDDDLGDHHNNDNSSSNQLSGTVNQSNKTPMKAPSSGGFLLSSLISSNISNDHDRYNEQRQLDTLYCVLNSLYAASEACRTLANTLDDILIDYDVDDNTKDNNETTTKSDKNDTTNSPGVGVIKTSSSLSSPTKDSMTTKAISKIQVTRDDVIQYSNDYQKLLTNRIDTSINMWCNNSNNQYSNNGTNINNCLGQLYDFFHNESYNIDGNTLNKMEQDERLINAMILPFQQSKLLQQFTNKCDIPILHIVAERLATIVVDMILNMLWNKASENNVTISYEINGTDSSDNHHNSPMKSKPKPNKRFTDWGALLLSKQSRMLQQYISSTMIQPSSSSSSSSTQTSTTIPPATKVIQIWERLSYVITVLQIEKPMDWITYYHTPTSSTTMSLTPDELYQTLQLRIDFSLDAIETVVSKIRSTS